MRINPSLFSHLIRRRLPEGPTLLLLPDPGATTVAIQAWLPSGSSAEGDDEAGLAHFLEHMIFKGSRGLGVGELAARVEASGGDINAYTMSDSTNYHLTCLPETMETCLADLTEALWWPRFEEVEIERERGVVLAEIDRSMDQPDQILQNHLFRKAYGKSHPYGRPIVGSRTSVSKFGVKSLRWFHRRCYDPSKTIIVLSGNVSEKKARCIIRKILEKRPRSASSSRGNRKSPLRVLDPSPEGKGPRIFQVRGRSGLAHLEIAFAVPSLLHKDAPALEALAMILGLGESSRLYHQLCVKAPMMHDATADVFFSLGEGLFFLGGMAAPEYVAASSGEIVRIMKKMAGDGPPTEEELRRTRLNFLSDMEFRRETVSGEARLVGYAQLLAGNARFAQTYLCRFMKVTPKDVQRVIKKYFHPEKITAGAFIPQSTDGKVDTRSFCQAIREGFTAPSEHPAEKESPSRARGRETVCQSKESAVPTWRTLSARKKNRVFESKFPGGGRLAVLPCGSANLIALRAVFLGGQRLESANWDGLNGLMAKVATQASRSIPSDDMARRIDGLAASVEGFSGRNSLGISVSGLSSVSDDLLEIFADVLTEPAFDKNDIALTLRDIRAERRSDQDELGHLSRLRAMSLLYGSHPFGRHPLGNPRILAKMDTRILRREWRRWTAPRNFVVAVAGDVDPADMEKKLKRLLRRWAEDAPRLRLPSPSPPPVSPLRGRSRQYSVEDATQSHLHMSFLGVNFTDPRRYALSIMTTALGSQGGGIFFELRERRGLAYAVHVSSEEALDPGPVSFYAATAPESEEEVLEVMRREIKRCMEDGLAAAEIERAKAYLIGEHFRTNQRAGAKASGLAFDLLYGLKREGPEEFKKKIRAVRADEIRDVARALLAPGKECVVRLGPSARKKRKTPKSAR